MRISQIIADGSTHHRGYGITKVRDGTAKRIMRHLIGPGCNPLHNELYNTNKAEAIPEMLYCYGGSDYPYRTGLCDGKICIGGKRQIKKGT